MVGNSATGETKTVFFHAGLPKTGSSAIQKKLHDDHDFLLERGFYYPRVRDLVGAEGVTLPDGSQGRLRGGHLLIAVALASGKRAVKLEREGAFGDIPLVRRTIDGFEASGCRDMLISAESLSMTMSSRAERLCPGFEDYDRQVAMLFRRKDHWLLSRYKQQIKDRRHSGDSFRTFIDNALSDTKNYFLICQKMQQFCEASRVIAIDYDRVKADIVGALCQAIGRGDLYEGVTAASEGAAQGGAKAVNVSLSNLASLFLMHCNAVLRGEKEQKQVRAALYSVDADIVASLGDVELMPAEFRRWAIQSHNTEVEEINRTFGAELGQIPESAAAAEAEARESLTGGEIGAILDAVAPYLAPGVLGALRAGFDGSVPVPIAAMVPSADAAVAEPPAEAARPVGVVSTTGRAQTDRAARRAARLARKGEGEGEGGRERRRAERQDNAGTEDALADPDAPRAERKRGDPARRAERQARRAARAAAAGEAASE